MQVGNNALAFFFLESDRCVQEGFLLFVFKLLQSQMVPYHFTLMEYDEHDHPDGQNQHPYCSEEQHERDLITLSCDLKKNHDLGSRMNLSFIRVFKNIVFKGVFERLLQVFTLLG